jgi:thiamine-phosphate pyrophosphorylase
MQLDRKILRLCLVTDRDLARGRALTDIAEGAVRGGATLVQLREKTATTRAFVEEARALKSLLKTLGVGLIINDRLDVALAVDADGVHVGQSDMRVEDVRRLFGPEKIVGLSITDASEIGRSDAAAADYLGVGPVYPQQTKGDAAPALGVEGFAQLRAMTQKPVVAIGGLKPENSAALLAAGADGLAVVSALVAAADPAAEARRFMRLFG